MQKATWQKCKLLSKRCFGVIAQRKIENSFEAKMVMQNKGQWHNIRDIELCLELERERVGVREAFQVIDEAKKRQGDVWRETEIIHKYVEEKELSYEVMAGNVYSLIAGHFQYLTDYFKRLNSHSKKLVTGQTLSKALLIASHIQSLINSSLSTPSDPLSQLYKETQKFTFRFHRFLLSHQRHLYYSLIYRQQLSLAKNHTDDKSHPLKTIGRFLFQNLWLDGSGGTLGEDTWPSAVTFKLPDIVRLFETQIATFDEGLFEAYVDLLTQQEQLNINEERDEAEELRRERFSQYSQLLDHLSGIVLSGSGEKSKQLKHLGEYAVSQLLINLDAGQGCEIGTLVKAITSVTNPVFMRCLDYNEGTAMLLVDSLDYIVQNFDYQRASKQRIDDRDVQRLTQYGSERSLIEKVLSIDNPSLNNVDIALYSKIRLNMQRDFLIEDNTSLNLKIKRLIIRLEEDGTTDKIHELFISPMVQSFSRSLQRHTQTSYIDSIKKKVQGLMDKQEIDDKVDFSQPLQPVIDSKEVLEQQLLRSMDEALETLSLLLYLACDIPNLNNPKVETSLHLLLDVLQTIVHQIDPWFIEQIILKYHKKGLLKERLGATGETLYQLTEDFVLSNWSLFGDDFRQVYRSEIYED